MMPKILSREEGLVLVTSVLLVLVLVVLAGVSMMAASVDLKITGNFKSNRRALYGAEAGVQEVRSRMRPGAPYALADSHPDQTQWRLYIGSEPKAVKKGYDGSNAMHVRAASLQPQMGFVVKALHQADAGGNILYWGDTNKDGINERTTSSSAGKKNIYFVTSESNYAGSSRVIEAELARMPPVDVPAALYVNTPATIQGASTNILGTDSCGAGDLPGITTPLPPGSITLNGGPAITGAGGATPNINYNATYMNVQNVIDNYKSAANFKYTVADVTHTASTSPGPGDGWGTPVMGATLQDPSTCSDINIVYYDAGGTDVKLHGGVTGCGTLLVEGNLLVSGDFSWYGVVAISGTIKFTGGGNKNITGAVIAKGTANADLIGGNANIVYCSDAVQDQTEYMPLQVLSWTDETSPS